MPTLTAHVIDTNHRVRGAMTIEVEFHAFIRPEAKFDSMDDLMAQMHADCDQARAILGS